MVFGHQSANDFYFAVFSNQNDGFTHGLFKIANGVQTELADFGTPVAIGTAASIRIPPRRRDTGGGAQQHRDRQRAGLKLHLRAGGPGLT